jgi:hypothetical protein
MPGDYDSILDVSIGSTQVVPFQVKDKPFSYISDHFGISTELKSESNLDRSLIVSEPTADTSNWVMEKFDLTIGFVSLGIVIYFFYSGYVSLEVVLTT